MRSRYTRIDSKLDHELNGLWPFMPQRDEIVKFIYIVFYSAVLVRGRYGRYGWIRGAERAEISVCKNFLI